MKLHKFFFYWGPVFGWCLLIFILSSIPTLPKVEIIWWDFVLKKTAHMVEYAILYLLVWRALVLAKFKIQRTKIEVSIKSLKVLNNKKIWFLPFIFGLFYAVSDEYHQSFVRGRTARVRDIGFDLAGMFFCFWWLKNMVKIKKSETSQ